MKNTLIFFFAVLSEVTATTALKFSEGFTKLTPSLIVVVGYGLSFYLLALSLKIIPLGTAYALWSGVLTVIVGAVLWHEQMDWAHMMSCLRQAAYIVNCMEHSFEEKRLKTKRL